jgi:hypothetical protein
MTYTLHFTRKNSVVMTRRQVSISAINLGAAMTIGRKMEADSRGVWQFEKAAQQ